MKSFIVAAVFALATISAANALGFNTDSFGKAYPAAAVAKYQRDVARELARPNVDTSPAYFNRDVESWGRQGD
jgi:hypothetical protein